MNDAIRLERSMLFVPATNPRVIAKAAAADCDAVCIDLEDAVAPADKPACRAHVIAALRELDFGHRLRMFRINGIDTHFAYRDLVEVVEAAGDRLDLVMLPKTHGPGDIKFVDCLLTQIESACGFTRRIGIEAQIETASGFLYAREIAAASDRLEAIIFGPGDFAASMQMPSSGVGEFDAHDALYPGHRWHAVMQTIVAAGRAHGLRCIDGPYAAFKDEDGFARSCALARALGFDGKQCIHPAQLAAANQAFAPATEEVEHARRVLAAVEAAAREGRGAASLDGKMIDAANLRLARVTVERSQLARRTIAHA